MANIMQNNSVLASTQINLAELGLDQLAYVRSSVIDNQQVWSIHNAAGAPVGAAPTREQAVGAILQHNLTPHFVN
ncbi:MAG: hypothetical protein RIC29_11515 [Rhodospirillaceae bacterium]